MECLLHQVLRSWAHFRERIKDAHGHEKRRLVQCWQIHEVKLVISPRGWRDGSVGKYTDSFRGPKLGSRHPGCDHLYP